MAITISYFTFFHLPMISEYLFIISLISSDCLSMGFPSVPMSLQVVAALIDSVSLERDFKSSDNFLALLRSSCNSDEINSSLTDKILEPSFTIYNDILTLKT